MQEFLKFITSVEGIALCGLALAILAGGINELVYLNRLCNSITKGCDDLRKSLLKFDQQGK